MNNSGSWALDRSETFSYDADLDYLTGADYNDGLANENPSWSYDAAGNRNDASVIDNLNRATTIGGVSRTYDIRGNTLTIGSSKTITWDELNRVTSLSISGGATFSYAYRTDGMRVSKDDGSTSTAFYYDGQMPVETSETTSSSTVVTRSALGARGIDRLEEVSSSGTTVGYPLYDSHGNMVATLGKSGSSYSLGNQRSYDAWGVVRQGATSGGQKGRYCANLGHVADDESGLTYMRARYYDQTSGRFISEDPSGDGFNWYVYASGDPINFSDQSGKAKGDTVAWVLFIIGIITSIVTLAAGPVVPLGVSTVLGILGLAVSLRANRLQAQALSDMTQKLLEAEAKALQSPSEEAAEHSLAAPAVTEIARETGEIQGALIAMELEESMSYDNMFSYLGRGR